jgi:hypothetical protein
MQTLLVGLGKLMSFEECTPPAFRSRLHASNMFPAARPHFHPHRTLKRNAIYYIYRTQRHRLLTERE